MVYRQPGAGVNLRLDKGKYSFPMYGLETHLTHDFTESFWGGPMKTRTSDGSIQGAQSNPAPAVAIYELTDPSAAGEDIDILDQDVVHLGSNPFSARRMVVNLDKSVFVFHSASHRVRSRTRLHPAMMALMVVGPTSRASIDGRDVDSNVLVAAEPGADVEILVDNE